VDVICVKSSGFTSAPRLLAARLESALPTNRVFYVAAVLLLSAISVVAADSARFAAIESLISQSKLQQAELQLQAILQQQPESSRAEDLLGTVRLRQKKYEEAESLFRRAASHDPKLVSVCQNLAALLRDEVRVDSAIAQYEKCLKLAPRSARNTIELAILYEQRGDYEKSLALAKSIPSAARPSKLLPVMAADYAALGKADQAGLSVGEVLQHALADPELVPDLANRLVEEGLAKDAAELLRVAQPRQKVTASLLAVAAKIQTSGGQYQQARQTIDNALRIDPKSIEALSTAAVLSGMALDWDASLKYLDTAMSVGPPRNDLLQQIVYAEMQKPDLQAAHAVAERWYKLQPDEPASALAFAVVLVEGNHWGEAKPLLEKVLIRSPNDKRAQMVMGVVEYNAGDLTASATHLTASLGQGPEDANAHYFLGLVAKQQGDIAGATSQMEQSLAVNPKNARALGSLGQLYLQQNDPAKAKAVLEKAIEVDPNEPQNHYELARVYSKLSLKEEAQEQLRMYEKLRPQRPPQSPQGEPASPSKSQ
jgi:tetratricopeptide (TPR) repeat protein